MLGIAPQHISDTAFAGALGRVRNAFSQKSVVPQICVRIKRHRREEDDDGLSQNVGGFDGDIQCGIVEGALRPLHPVDDAAAFGIGIAGPADRDAWIR